MSWPTGTCTQCGSPLDTTAVHKCGVQPAVLTSSMPPLKSDIERIVELESELARLRAELKIAREAYTNIGSERDMIQAELDRVRELITRDEITRIREEIKDATDSKQCSKRDGFIIFGYRCDFWKRAALEGK